MIKNRLTVAVSAALGLTAAAAFPQVANAQDDLVEEVVVTGSRIQKANLVSSSPVTQVNAEEFKFQGNVRVEDLLNKLPSVYASNTSGDANGATGTATLNLRNLGSVRTLTLLNGRRLPPGSPAAGGYAADVNQVPGALIQRVEVLTGGASSTYGSDAVAGVVNFILVDDFEGLKVDYQYSGYTHNNDNGSIQDLNRSTGFDVPDGTETDGEISDLSVIFGANLDGGRGNVTAYFTYRNIDPVVQGSRDYSNCALGGTSDNFSCGGSSTLPEGRFTDFGLLAGTGPGSFDYIVSGDQFVPRDGLLYNYAPLNFFQRPDERYTGGAFARYSINEHVEAYGEVMFMDDRSNAQIAPSGAFFVTSALSCGNPFLSAQQFDLVCGQYGLGDGDFQDVFIGRRNVEGGARNNDLRHTSIRGVFGLRGDINDTWRYDAYAQYAEVSYEETYNNDLSTTKIIRALDAVEDADGNVTCRSVIDGSDPTCVPWNLFTEGAVTQNMLNYLYLPLFARGTTDQKVVSGYVAGDLGEYNIQIPSAETGVQVVLGTEYRSENLEFSPDNGYQSGDGAGQGGPILGVNGGYDVTEFFTEISIPLVEGKSFAEELNLDLGYRWSDYSTDVQTDTYKVAAGWAPVASLKFRASFNHAVRAANIRELFRPQGIGLFDMTTDVCATATPSRTLEECARTGVTAGQYGTIADSPAGQYNQITGGNPDLQPEESDTYSFGLVWTPEFADGLAITLDYFDIEVEGAIAGIGSEEILNSCYETGDSFFCGLVNRGPATGTLWLGNDNVVNTDINTGFFATAGLDYTIDYSFDIGDMGSLNFNNIGTLVDSWEQQATPNSDVVSCEGTWGGVCGSPNFELVNNFRVTWLTPWDLALSGAWRYMSEVEDNDDTADFDAQNYLDVSAVWDVTEMISLRAGINNVTDEEPPLGPAPGPSIFGNGNTFPGYYDALGMYWFLGASVQF